MKTATLLLCLAVAAGTAACDSAPDDAYYQPSRQKFDFNFGEEISFGEYVARHMTYLKEHRVYHDINEAEAELSRIVPYEMPIPSNCEAEPSRGALLIHGISDTAYSLREIAEFLNSDCVLVRAMVLPGHGTRPGDLLHITREEWTEAVNFGIRTLKREVDQVYLVGFSLGGLLAVQAATVHPFLSGLILLSPSLQTTYSALVWQTRWLRYFSEWVDVDPNASPVRYHSMPTNGLAELIELRSDTIRSIWSNRGIKPAVFAMLAEHDISVHSEKTLRLLQEFSPHEKSRFVYYGTPGEDARDSRTLYRRFYLPELRILNFSHVAFFYSPDNPLFGTNGSIKECGENIGVVNQKEAALCLETDAPWKGELGSTDDEKFLPIQRLTYNPHFDTMMKDIHSFMEETGEVRSGTD